MTLHTRTSGRRAAMCCAVVGVLALAGCGSSAKPSTGNPGATQPATTTTTPTTAASSGGGGYGY